VERPAEGRRVPLGRAAAIRAQSMEFSELNVEYGYCYQSAAAAPVSAHGRVSRLTPPFLVSAVILLSRRGRPRRGGVVADAGFVEGGPFPLLG
jgi:hypothetical protein